MIATITSKGQLTLPKKLRDTHNLQPGSKVEFVVDEQGRITMIPIKSSIKELKGMVPRPKDPISIKKMQKAIEKGIST
jgi:AbrB family looped-hinge helix DNA binding protein